MCSYIRAYCILDVRLPLYDDTYIEIMAIMDAVVSSVCLSGCVSIILLLLQSLHGYLLSVFFQENMCRCL